MHRRGLITAAYKAALTHWGLLDVPKNGIEMYKEHNAWIKSLVKPENLLVYNVKDGWEPLCSFLGRKIPDKPFPRVNDEEAYVQA